MKTQQGSAVNFLRGISYLILYDPHSTFLNHAKFMLCYHVCFSERIAYHGKYFGSTNITMAGLSHQPGKVGNYEEFQYRGYRPRRSLSRSDLGYLDEVLTLTQHASSLYSSEAYLRRCVNTHIDLLETSISRAQNTLQGTTLGELFRRYVELEMAFSQTISWLDELPGRSLTEELMEKILGRHEAPNPFELEMLACDDQSAESVAATLGFTDSTMRKAVSEWIRLDMSALDDIKSSYIPRIGEIGQFKDSSESSFTELLEKSRRKHEEYLPRVIELASSSTWPKEGR
jgi:hypothetical protein